MTVGAGPLQGIRVVDLSTVFAVPYAAGLLGDLGAEVIKIEAPDRLEQTRGVVFGPMLDNVDRENPWDYSGSFQVLNRNKRSIALNLRTEEGREVLWRLLADADILLDNFTPRVLRGWGMSPREVAKRNPRLIHLSNTGFGSSGPWQNFKAQGTTLEYTMGVGAYSGYVGSTPQKVGQSYPDFLAAWAGLTAIMAALLERSDTGVGQWIDVGMYQLGPAVIPEAVIAAQFGESLGLAGSADRDAAVSGVFETQHSERWVALSATSAQWDALVSQHSELGVGDVHDATVRWAAAHTSTEIIAACDAIGIAVAPVLDARDLISDEQLRLRGFFEQVATPDDSDQRPMIGRPYTWTGPNRVAIRHRAPRFGEHNDRVLAGIGTPVDRIDWLRKNGVLTDVPVGAPRISPQDLDLNCKIGSYRYIDSQYRAVVATVGNHGGTTSQ